MTRTTPALRNAGTKRRAYTTLRALAALLRAEQGASLTEYALFFAVAAISMIAAFSFINESAGQQYSATTSNFESFQISPP